VYVQQRAHGVDQQTGELSATVWKAGQSNAHHKVDIQLTRLSPLHFLLQVEKELSEICASILQLLDEHLIPTAASGESKVFYLKMKGDYHRYLAEFKTGADRKEAAEHTLLAYKAAQVGSCGLSTWVWKQLHLCTLGPSLVNLFNKSIGCQGCVKCDREATWHPHSCSSWRRHLHQQRNRCQPDSNVTCRTACCPVDAYQ